MSGAPFEHLMALREHVSIVHHVPGRLRLRVGRGFQEAIGGPGREAAETLLASLDGILAIRVNALAASVILEYDARRLRPSWWEQLLEGTDAEAATLIGTLVRAVA